MSEERKQPVGFLPWEAYGILKGRRLQVLAAISSLQGNKESISVRREVILERLRRMHCKPMSANALTKVTISLEKSGWLVVKRRRLGRVNIYAIGVPENLPEAPRWPEEKATRLANRKRLKLTYRQIPLGLEVPSTSKVRCLPNITSRVTSRRLAVGDIKKARYIQTHLTNSFISKVSAPLQEQKTVILKTGDAGWWDEDFERISRGEVV